MTNLSIPSRVIEILTSKNESSTWNPSSFHDVEVSKFLAYFYRDMITAIEEEIEEGFNTSVLEDNQEFLSELTAHVYTLTRTDYTKFHDMCNSTFVEAIEILKPTYYKALSNKLDDERLNLSICAQRLKAKNKQFAICKELQGNCLISQLSA